MTDPDIVVRLRESDGGYFMRQMFTEAVGEIERLRFERDEARREVCELKALNFDRVIRPKDYALLRKWDCFEVKQ
jgi:hypothetical protein